MRGPARAAAAVVVVPSAACAAWASAAEAEAERVRCETMLRGFFARYERRELEVDVLSVEAVERPFSFQLDDGTAMAGVIDRVDRVVSEEGAGPRYRIRDFKTRLGAFQRRRGARSLQLAIYARAWRDVAPDSVGSTRVALESLETGERIERAPSQKELETALQEVGAARARSSAVCSVARPRTGRRRGRIHSRRRVRSHARVHQVQVLPLQHHLRCLGLPPLRL